MHTDLNVVYVYVVNDDLKMTQGKIAAQVSHVAMMIANQDGNNGIIGKAVVLKGSRAFMEAIIAQIPKEITFTVDAGLTEVPPNSLTCIGFKRTPENYYLTAALETL